MSRLVKAHSVVAFVLLVGMARTASADEGPAINPSIYKVPDGAKTINVDCDARQTLAAALADKSTGDLNIVFSGTCKEYIYLQRDGVAIRGKDANATVVGAVEVTGAKRVLLENFTCRDNTQSEYCIGAIHGAGVMLHNLKVFNAGIRGIEIFNSVAIIEGLTVDKTGSTSILIRGSQARLEGELTFGHTLEGCVVVDGVSSVFSKSGVLTARDCAAGLIVENNSSFQAPFATFNLNHNTVAGLMLFTNGTFSYGGSIIAKNNTQAGIYLDEAATFAPFSNILSGSTVTLENNGQAGVYVTGGSLAELANVTSISGSTYGLLVDNGSVKIHHSKITDNKTADVRLSFGSRAIFGDEVTLGTFTCDGTQLVRGAKTPCAQDSVAKAADAKPADPKPASVKPAPAKPSAKPGN